MQIIKAGKAELEVVAPLFNEYRVYYEQRSDLEAASTYLGKRMENNESVIFLACNEQRNEGFGFVQLYPSFTSIGMQSIWILNDLFVTEAARKQGIARKLMMAAREHAEQTIAKRLILETNDDNYNAQKLYESLGYKKESGIYHYILDVD